MTFQMGRQPEPQPDDMRFRGAWAIVAVMALVIGAFSLWGVKSAGAAVSCSLVTAGESNVDGTAYTTASVAITAGQLNLLFVNTEAVTTPTGIPTASATGVTWTQQETNPYGGAQSGRETMFRAMPATTQTGVTTITAPATAKGAHWSIVTCSGVDTSGVNGAGAISDSRHGSTTATTSISHGFDINSPSAGTVIIVGTSHDTNEGTTPASGLTELSDTNHTNSSTGHEVATGTTYNTNTTWATSSNAAYTSAALAVAPPPTTTTTTAATTTTVAPTTTTTAPPPTTTTTPEQGIYYETVRFRSESLAAFSIVIFLLSASFVYRMWGVHKK